MATDFEYDLPMGCIRLVQIQTGDLQKVSLTCNTFALRNAPSFTALSYSWGGEEMTQRITLQGKLFLITPNLEAFLQEAWCRMEQYMENRENELEWKGGWLWIDAVCINQKHTPEKNTQVAMMKDIYESAQTIISWLGAMDEDSELGMEFILNFDHFRQMRSPAVPSKFSQDIMPFDEWKILRDRALNSVQRLISRGYWRRMWIVQEATTPNLSNQSLVWCGGYSDTFDAFTKSADWLTRLAMVDGLPGKLHDSSTDALRALILVRALRNNSLGLMDLQIILPYIQTFCSTDPRDKIFGVLSLLPSKIGSMCPDYSSKTEDVYFDLACRLIEEQKSLDILGFCSVISGDFELPSWVPDWTAAHGPKPFLHHTLNHSGSLDNLYHASNDTLFDGYIDKEEGILYASGFVFDKIEWIAVPRVSNSGRDGDIGHQWTLAALGKWSKYITGCSREAAFGHLLCADVADYDGDPNSYSQLGIRPSSVSVPEHDDHLGIFEDPSVKIRDATMNRVLFFTEKGYMGLAPYTAQVGQKVCLLEGAQMPVIMERENGCWTVIGESYIHGLMDGRGWDEMMAKEDSELDNFEIR